MEEELLALFKGVISEKTGLNVREKDAGKVMEFIGSRVKSLRPSSPDEYYWLLRTDNQKSKSEWQELVNRLTTGETYFFRDKGQFALLKNWILPELIKNRKAERKLHIWSAGCSSGEEPYSLAILVDELVPDRRDWDIFIIGTDINREAIEKAERGIYSEWSFRGVNKEVWNRYFQQVKKEWKIDEDIRRMVTFRTGNLIADAYPEPEIHDIDLILCRNVFIYFNRDVVSAVVRKFVNTLREGGYLMTGHAETDISRNGGLKPKVFPESVIYQKSSEVVRWAVPTETKTEPRIQKPEVRIEKPKFKIPDSKKDSELRIPHSAFEEAKAYADRGRYDEAIRYCKEVIKGEPFNAAPYYLLAQIAHEKGDLDQEKEMLKKVIYLSPSNVAAYLELGVIYENEGDEDRALKMRTTALEILMAMPKDTRIEPYEEFTAGELVEHVKRMVKL